MLQNVAVLCHFTDFWQAVQMMPFNNVPLRSEKNKMQPV